MPDRADTLLTVEQEFKKPPADAKNLAKKVHDYYSQAKDARIHKDQTYLKQYKMYRFTGGARKFPWRSNIYIPMGHVNVLVKTARMLAALKASDPFFRASARSMRFAQNEEAVQMLMQKQHEDMDWWTVIHDWQLDKYIYGIGILKMHWLYDENVEMVPEMREREVYVKDGGELIPVGTEMVEVKVPKRTVVFDGPVAEVVNIFDCYWDPNATNIRKARYVIHRKNVTIDYLYSKAEQGVYKRDAVERIAASKIAQGSKGGEKDTIATIEQEDIGRDLAETIEILECTTRNRIMVAADGELLRDVPNKFKQINFFEDKHLRSAHKSSGMGTNEPIEEIHAALNKVHNLRFDSWSINVYPMFAIDMGAIFNPADLIARPGGYVRVNSGRDTTRAIVEINKQQLPVEAYTEQSVLERLNEVITGVTEPQQGVASGKGEQTATETRFTAAGTSTRFAVELILLEPVLKQILEFHHLLNQMFLDQPRVIRILGEQGQDYPINPENVEGEYDFMFELSPLQGNREAWIQRLLLVSNALSQNPMTAPFTNWMELGKRMIKAADLRSPETLLNLDVFQFNQQVMGIMAMTQAASTMPSDGGQTGPATNPSVGAANAKTRTPQQTPNDYVRDVYAGER